MDPNAVLAKFLDNVCSDDGDWRDAREAAADLCDWLRRGGFRPTDPRQMGAISRDFEKAVSERIDARLDAAIADCGRAIAKCARWCGCCDDA